MSTEIRNFCIIAHIDHGKSTLADRLLELTGTVERRHMKQQLLDKMDLEREKGITIKLAPVRLNYQGVQLNLIDTPGHVDFSYEVSRSLQACEGAILVIDATQGIQAQTLANVYLALENELEIIPVLNKIDLPAADVERVTKEVVALLNCQPDELLRVSAKTGEGVELLLDRLVERIPPPVVPTSQAKTTRALIFDSYYDDYRGVILYVRLVNGQIKRSAEILMMATETPGIALEVGYLSPEMQATDSLEQGEIGYLVTNLKTTAQAQVGDTVTLKQSPASQSLPGYKQVKPFVFASLFPVQSDQYPQLQKALEKLSLSDSALSIQAETSSVLGHGFRIGFLGLLHLEIVRERLSREYQLELITSNPSTEYKLHLTNGQEMVVSSAAELPAQEQIAEIQEPWVKAEIVCPNKFVGPVLQLIVSQRGQQQKIDYVDQLAIIIFQAPLANLLVDFYDELKSRTSGYGSFNYELQGYQAEDLVRLDFYVAGEMIAALSTVRHRSEAVAFGRVVVKKLKQIIPKQQFKVALQAAIGGKFIAREDLSGFRKDVTAKLYGGDVSRRKKLLEKQKRGKSRMKKFGQVELPPETFTVLLQRDQD